MSELNVARLTKVIEDYFADVPFASEVAATIIEQYDRGDFLDSLTQTYEATKLYTFSAAPSPALTPHPDTPHEFRTVCRLCGENGYLHVALITDLEVVKIEPLLSAGDKAEAPPR